MSPLFQNWPSHHRQSCLSKRNPAAYHYQDQVVRPMRPFTSAPSDPFNKSFSRRLLLSLGGGICAGTCLLWYYKKHFELLHAATLAKEFNETDLDGRGQHYVKETPKLLKAKCKARELLQRVKDEHGCPGIVAAVSVNGEHVWDDAIGFADVENQLPMTAANVLRIASISKVLTVTALAKLWEDGKVDIDKPIQEFVPSFPEKVWEKEKVTITTRQILSHLSGIRHYRKRSSSKDDDSSAPSVSNDNDFSKSKSGDGNSSKEKESEGLGDARYPEMYSKTKYKDITGALDQFRDDPLVHKPGSKFLYSTHAWTLVSAVIESAAKKPYLQVMQETFDELGLTCTVPDQHKPLIPNRARMYERHLKTNKLENAPYVDLSNKWAGGGFMSTVGDLVKFGDAMLYSYQYSPRCKGHLPGYLKAETIRQLWLPVEKAKPEKSEAIVGLGWYIIDNAQRCGHCRPSRHDVLHTGGAVGASSVLLVAPEKQSETRDDCCIPRGVTVAIIVNINGVSLTKTAQSIARLFGDVE